MSRVDAAAYSSLYERAQEVADCAYAPYSGFHVGAALLTVNGEIYTGCNIENASLGLTMCAERSACAAAVSTGHRNFEAIAIAVQGGTSGQPCGACRQFLAEFAPELTVVYPVEGQLVARPLSELLPDRFELAGRPTLDHDRQFDL